VPIVQRAKCPTDAVANDNAGSVDISHDSTRHGRLNKSDTIVTSAEYNTWTKHWLDWSDTILATDAFIA